MDGAEFLQAFGGSPSLGNAFMPRQKALQGFDGDAGFVGEGFAAEAEGARPMGR